MKISSKYIFALLLGLILPLAVAANVKLQQAQTYLQAGNTADALDLTNQLLEQDPNNIEARFMKGLILTRIDRLPDAEQVFIKLTEDHPNLPEPYNNLAVVYAAQGKFDDARDALKRAINTHPTYATAHENLGDIYAKMASRAYNQALELDNGNSSAREKLSLVKDIFSPAPGSSAVAQQQEQSQAPVQEPAPSIVEQVIEQVEPAAAPSIDLPQVETPAVATNVQPGPVVEELVVEEVTEPEVVAAPVVETDPQINTTIDQWQQAWSAQEITDYLNQYSKNFVPSFGLSRIAWADVRRERIQKPEFIRISIENLRIQMQGESIAKAKFLQSYSSDTYEDKVNKVLVLQKEGYQWKIIKEYSY